MRVNNNQFNFSNNPSYVTGTEGAFSVVTVGEPFSYITSVGLYDASDNLLAVAKMSRPIEKNDEKDLTVRVRLDF